MSGHRLFNDHGLTSEIAQEHLRYVEEGARRFAIGEFEELLTVPSESPISGIVRALNDMALKLRAHEKMRRDFVANVSHELRTPITSIKGFIETLRDGAIDDPQDSQRFLKIVLDQSERLNAIIEDLLILSRIESHEHGSLLPREECNIQTILMDVMLPFGARIKEKNLEYKVRVDPELRMEVNGHLVQHAVSNLVSNAIKYSPASSLIEIEALVSNGELRISVSDSGPGIEAIHLDRIFERFYVVDKARSRKLGGTGLGLAIVKHVALAHSGRVEVASAVGRGTTFHIFIPGIQAFATNENAVINSR